MSRPLIAANVGDLQYANAEATFFSKPIVTAATAVLAEAVSIIICFGLSKKQSH
jgi:hypothetical protein